LRQEEGAGWCHGKGSPFTADPWGLCQASPFGGTRVESGQARVLITEDKDLGEFAPAPGGEGEAA
jgi:hypothetical protein